MQISLYIHVEVSSSFQTPWCKGFVRRESYVSVYGFPSRGCFCKGDWLLRSFSLALNLSS